ncbi:hypothetical protein ACTJIJ_19265 [Niabella sp. 22666]|uniref:hypothetical protein n=1 Tax=Niabella sp. 22666 TaxID=3453954 RepID=UPI003F835C24
MKILLSAYFLIVASLAVLGQEPGASKPNKRLEPGKEAPFNFRMIVNLPYVIDFPTDSSQQTDIGKRYDSILAKHSQLDKDFDFRFQLKQYYMLPNHDNVFVLTLKKDKWRAQYFTTYVNPAADNKSLDVKFVEQQDVDQSGVDQLWELLAQNDILTLPNQRSIDNELTNYVVDTVSFVINRQKTATTDGVLYEFDFESPEKQRHYTYANPNEYFRNYPHVKALANTIINIALIRKFLKQPISSF